MCTKECMCTMSWEPDRSISRSFYRPSHSFFFSKFIPWFFFLFLKRREMDEVTRFRNTRVLHRFVDSLKCMVEKGGRGSEAGSSIASESRVMDDIYDGLSEFKICAPNKNKNTMMMMMMRYREEGEMGYHICHRGWSSPRLWRGCRTRPWRPTPHTGRWSRSRRPTDRHTNRKRD